MIQKVCDTIYELGGVLGILKKETEDQIPGEVQALLTQRAAARSNKDWAASDALRDQLREMGYLVKDTPQGQQLSKA